MDNEYGIHKLIVMTIWAIKQWKTITGKTWEASTDSKSVSQWHIYGMGNHQPLSIYHSCKQIFFVTNYGYGGTCNQVYHLTVLTIHYDKCAGLYRSCNTLWGLIITHHRSRQSQFPNAFISFICICSTIGKILNTGLKVRQVATGWRSGAL